MTAYTEGKIIQMRSRHRSDGWHDVSPVDSLWNWCDCDYRVKPEVTLPKTWEEFCKYHPIEDDDVFIGEDSEICHAEGGEVRYTRQDAYLLPNEQIAESMLALCQLIQLRDCYNGEWKPNWKDNSFKYVIYTYCNEIIDDRNVGNNAILTFKTEELRDEFLNNFRKLIEKAKPLL